MKFNKDLGVYSEKLVAAYLRTLGHVVTPLDFEYQTNFRWGDLYSVTPDGAGLFLTIKGRTALEHQKNGSLVLNPCYDGKGLREFTAALERLAELRCRVDCVAAISVALHLDHSYDMYLISLDQMVVTGKNLRWSIPMRAIDRKRYLHLTSGHHCFDWSLYPERWFYRTYLEYEATRHLPPILERKPRRLRRRPLPDVFPEIMKEPYAVDVANRAFGFHPPPEAITEEPLGSHLRIGPFPGSHCGHASDLII